MAIDSDMAPLDSGASHRRRPQFINAFNVGQVAQIVTLVIAIGGVVMYQRAETEAIRSAAAVQAVRLETLKAEAASSKDDTQRQFQTQKETLNEIKSDVKNVSTLVQNLSIQVHLSSQQNAPAAKRQ